MKAKGVHEMRAEFEFDYAKAVRGKYYRQLIKEGSNIAVLDPDVAKAFKDSAAVNQALRSLLKVTEDTRRLVSKSTSRAKQKRSA